jgi:glucose dehydrogenase
MLSFSTSQTKAVHVRSHCWLAMLLLAPLLISCRKTAQTVQPPAGGGGQLHPYAGQLETDDGQWVRASKDYANTRYSSLDQINTGNVGSLKVAWTFDTGSPEDRKPLPSWRTTRCMSSRRGRTHCLLWT